MSTVASYVDQKVDDVLNALGNDSAAPGSGAALALTLHIAAMALKSQLALTVKNYSNEQPPFQQYHKDLQSKLEAAAEQSEKLYEADSITFGKVVEYRIARNSAINEEKKLEAVMSEVPELQKSNNILVQLIHLAHTLEDDARLMFDQRGIKRARGEAAVAFSLSQAVKNAAADILCLNLEALVARRNKYNVEVKAPENPALLVTLIPSNAVVNRLQSALDSATVKVA